MLADDTVRPTSGGAWFDSGDLAGRVTMATQWFYMCMGEVCGPCTSTDLRSLASKQTVMEESLVRKGLGGEWVPASRIKGLFDVPPIAVVEAAIVPEIPSAKAPPPPPALPPTPSPVLSVPELLRADHPVPTAAAIPRVGGSLRALYVIAPIAAAVFVVGSAGGVALFRGTRPSLNPIQSVRNVVLQSAYDGVIKADERNGGVRASVYYRDLFGNSVLVFDLKDVAGHNSRGDVFRVLIDFAESLKNKPLRSVELACLGKTRFTMDGSYFKKLGEERRTQNPIYTIRTLPENLKTPDGEPAYPEWTGGMLGVVNQQMEEFGDVHEKWYVDALRDAK